MFGYFVFALLLPSFVVSQASHCYRCFGSTWCNNFTDPSFIDNVDTVECQTTNTYSFEGNNPYTQSLLESLKTVAESSNGPENNEGSLMGCVTATVHEAHEDHTVRVCINQASVICPTIRNVVLSNVNDISPDVRLSCEGCTGSLCNTHTLIEDEIITPPPSSPSSDTPSPSTADPPLTESSTITSESSSSSNPSSPSSESSTATSESSSSSNPSSPSSESSTATSESSSSSNPSSPSSESSTATSGSSSSSDSTPGSSSSSATSEETTTELPPTTNSDSHEETTQVPGSGQVVFVSNQILLITIIVNYLI